MINTDDLILDDDEVAAMQKCGYTEEEAIAFKGVYNHYDSHFGKGDGKCSVALVKSMVRALGISMQKDDEDRLATLLDEVDENKDGSTQFAEFLLLISRMQAINFCNMNNAAADRVQREKEAEEKRKAANKRKEAEKAGHRASLLYLQDQDKVFDALAKKQAEIDAMPKQANSDSEDEGGGFGMKHYDPATDGPYKFFYWKHHKAYLDNCKAEFDAGYKPGRTRTSSRSKPSK